MAFPETRKIFPRVRIPRSPRERTGLPPCADRDRRGFHKAPGRVFSRETINDHEIGADRDRPAQFPVPQRSAYRIRTVSNLYDADFIEVISQKAVWGPMSGL